MQFFYLHSLCIVVEKDYCSNASIEYYRIREKNIIGIRDNDAKAFADPTLEGNVDLDPIFKDTGNLFP